MTCVCAQAYTMGLEYCHVEARKSPVLDGVVERDDVGMEVSSHLLLVFAWQSPRTLQGPRFC